MFTLLKDTFQVTIWLWLFYSYYKCFFISKSSM